MRRPIKLVCVTSVNNNKFYNMSDNGDGTFTVEYGRIGVTQNTGSYPIRKWDTKYREKIRKGYKDVSELSMESPSSNGSSISEAEIKDGIVRDLVRRLKGYAQSGIRKTYTVSSKSVTQSMIDEAQDILNSLSNSVDGGNLTWQRANGYLLDLYHVIPRRMGDVKDHLIYSNRELGRHGKVKNIIREEQDNIDMMAQQVSADAVADVGDNKSVLDAMGIEIKRASAKEESEVFSTYPDARRTCGNVFSVTNHVTLSRFSKFLNQIPDDRQGEIELLWHGSRNENWLSILESGLLIRPTGVITTGSMFGNGIYFANTLEKSLHYTGSYCSIFSVYLGKMLKMPTDDNSMNASKLAKRGDYDSVWGAKGYTKSWGGPGTLYNDEFIIYNPMQSTIKFLLEVRSGHNWR